MTYNILYVFSVVLSFVTVGNAQTSLSACQDLATRGECHYYECLDGHLGECGPDSYLVGYGFKYCNRFNTFRNSFDSRGQQWTDDVRRCLINELHTYVLNNNQRQVTCDEAAMVGFDSHPDCYTDNGFCDVILQVSDCRNMVGLLRTIGDNFRETFISGQYRQRSLKQIWDTVTTPLCLIKAAAIAASSPSYLSLCAAQHAYDHISGLMDRFITSVSNYFRGCSNSVSSRVDIVFVMDASGSIGGERFQSMTNFVANIVLGFSQNVHAGVVRYSSSASVIQQLTQVTNPGNLAAFVRSITYTGGGTNTAAGIQVGQSLFQTADRCSENVKVLYILTDGRSNDLQRTIQAANAAKNDGIQIYTSGIGSSVNQEELTAVASSPSSDYMLPIANFSNSAFNDRVSTLQRGACTTPLSSEVGDCTVARTLEKYDGSYFQFQVPIEGMTLHTTATGVAGVYGSFSERNPNPLTADFETRGSGMLSYFVKPPSDRKRRQSESGSTVYISVIALDEGNTTIEVMADIGDSTNFSLVSGIGDQSIRYGDTHNFTCTVRGTGTLIFELSQRNIGVVSEDQVTGSEEQNTTGIMTITDVTEMSGGIYWCNVTGEGKTVGSDSGILTVIVPSPKVSISHSSEEGKLFSGENLILSCEVNLAAPIANTTLNISFEGPEGVISYDAREQGNKNLFIISTSVLLGSTDTVSYICRVKVSPQEDSSQQLQYVIFEEGMDTLEIMTQGKPGEGINVTGIIIGSVIGGFVLLLLIGLVVVLSCLILCHQKRSAYTV